MIDKIGRGWDAPGLIGYLMGPGRANEHTRPTVIAAWQSDPGALQPVQIGPDDFDLDPAGLAALRAHVQAPADAAGLPRRQPVEGEPGHTKHGYVWHCSIALPAGDGALTHDQWSQIAAEVMDRTGIAAADDPGGCRWVAVHHGTSSEGNDHIHIAATLVRQDTGKRFYPKNDFHVVRSVAREWEQRLGVTATGQADQSAQRETTRGEHEKTSRLRAGGKLSDQARTDPAEAVRGQLRQSVEETAATAGTSEEFLAGLRERGLLVHLRHNSSGEISGYAVADPQFTTRGGEPVFYGGRTLARDLSWPKMNREWARHGGPLPEKPAEKITWDLTSQKLREAAGAVVHAHNELRTTGDEQVRRDIAVAGQRLMVAYSQVTDGRHPEPGRPRTAAVWQGQRSTRAARITHDRAAGPAAAAADALNDAARNLLMLRMVAERGPARSASIELAVALSMLMLEIAAWHEQRHQPNAALAARSSAASVRAGAPQTVGAPNTPTPANRSESAERTPAASRGQLPHHRGPQPPPRGPAR